MSNYERQFITLTPEGSENRAVYDKADIVSWAEVGSNKVKVHLRSAGGVGQLVAQARLPDFTAAMLDQEDDTEVEPPAVARLREAIDETIARPPNDIWESTSVPLGMAILTLGAGPAMREVKVYTLQEMFEAFIAHGRWRQNTFMSTSQPDARMLPKHDALRVHPNSSGELAALFEADALADEAQAAQEAA